jgi:hypothetical protein
MATTGTPAPSPAVATKAATVVGGTDTKYESPTIPDAPGKARYDKTDPYGGTFRAYLAANWPTNLVGKVIGVSIEATGKLVPGGAGVSGLVGVIVLTQAHKVNEGQVDVMRFGCIVGFAETAGKAATAGTKYYADKTTGLVSTTAGGMYVGTTLGADRLEVLVNLPSA